MAVRRQRRSSTSCSQQLETITECLSRCQFEPHADLVTRCASMGNLDLLKHCVSICSNPWNIRDAAGRNVLHVAASCGHLDLVLWLLKKKGRIKIDSTDLESRWTALHRTAYLGYAGVLAGLFRNGGNLEQLDYDKFSPLNILQYNMETVRKSRLTSSTYLYVWGTNSNMTLGHDHARTTPKLLEVSSQYGDIKQVVICKFHSVFLSERGGVFTCGHGHGGRLGHGNDKSCLSPKLVQGLRKERCVAVAAARDHTVFLTENGVVYTCGLNDTHQLGQTPKTPGSPILPFSLSPFYLRSLKGKTMIAIGAGRYHTAVCTKQEIYTCGKNLGQLGYDKTTETQIQPKIVTGIHIDSGDYISHFSVSDSATACITRNRRIIYVCAKNTVLRCERLAIPETLSIVQFVLCASLGELQHKQGKKKSQSPGALGGGSSGSGLTLGLTDSSNQLWITHWSDFTKKSCSAPQLVPGSTKRSVSHFTITKNLTVVTPQGEIFTAPLTPPNLPSLLSLKRVSHIQQALKVFTDYKVNNMAVLQTVHHPPKLPTPENSTFNDDIYNLLSEENLPGSVSDVTFDVVGKRINANKLVLSSQSKVFSSMFSSLHSSSSGSLPRLVTAFDRQDSFVSLSFSNPKIFELFLRYLYGAQLTFKTQNQPTGNVQCTFNSSSSTTSNSKTSLDDSVDTSEETGVWNSLYDRFGVAECHILEDLDFSEEAAPPSGKALFDTQDTTSGSSSGKGDGKLTSEPLSVSYETSNLKEDLGLLKQLAAAFRTEELLKRVDSVLSSNSKTHSCTIKGPQLVLWSDSCPHDIVITSESGTEHYCHKCVLVARSDYFQSMLLMGWRETSSEDHVTTLKLPMSDELVEMVIEYLYTDKVQDSSSLEWLTSALTTSDQLLLKRLKTICELSLAKLLTLDNVGYIIDLSEVYNAEQLLTSCVQFVCLNLPALLEAGGLEGVSNLVLDRLSKTYREMFPEVSKRKGLKLRELTVDEVPSSYLLNEPIESTDEETEEGLSWMNSVSTTPTSRAKSPLFSSLDVQGSVSKTTPTSGSGHKKRRRRGSAAKGERSRQLFTPPTSPEPKSEGRSCNSLENLDRIVAESSQLHDDVTNDLTEDSVKSRSEKEEEPIMDDEKKGNTLAKRGSDPWGRKKSIGSEKDRGDMTNLKEIMEKEKTQRGFKKGDKSSVMKKEVRTRTSEKDIRSKKTEPVNLTVVKSPPLLPAGEGSDTGIVRSASLPLHSPSSSPWGLNESSPSSSTCVSLRTLMAEAEAEDQAIKQERRRAVVQRPSNQSDQKKRQIQRERRVLFPCSPLSTSPVVSFSDIVTHQQLELDQRLHNQSHKKPLQLIQIEEEAIQELLSVYASSDNSKEYITIERVSMGVIKNIQVPPTRRTSAPYTGATSAWYKKKKF